MPIPSDRSNSYYTEPNTDPNCPPKRGLQHREYLTSDVKVFGCRTCKTHLSIHEHIESKNFNGQHGRAYLFTTVYNINAGPPEDRPMTTGLHTVRDISCAKCTANTYKAYDASQKYKEGKFILERTLTVDVS
ncbi:BQ5605_C031g10999 [Microbotryum silenes-dioicae]|uniref:BQ5605_C031g10999 protein n=1 Tax=Microbotryum silenes-dioicae TaxID=796604 RepID=A0A2X0NAP3_9BASI|nr:BQ5605_C031g10999 [Microbotryum silenes-dioicae]